MANLSPPGATLPKKLNRARFHRRAGRVVETKGVEKRWTGFLLRQYASNHQPQYDEKERIS